VVLGLLRSGRSAPRERAVLREIPAEVPTGSAAAPTLPEPQPAEATQLTPAVDVAHDAETMPPAVAEPAALPDAAAATVPASPLEVVEHGVGLGVVRRRLVGRGDRFDPGDRVWFWTRVAGGERGQSIHHVWLRDGLEVGTVLLALDGPDTGAASQRTLSRGSGGRWTVEARDLAGRVLARRDFLCVSP
jgi:hypothetical protein